MLMHHGTKRVVIEATANCPKPVTLIVAHLALMKSTRMKQLDELSNIINRIKHPVILMGDFNTFNGLHELDHLIEKTHLYDTFKLNKSSIKFTYPAWHPNRRLDYILTSKEIIVKDYKIIKCEFSDHLPVMIDFNFRKEHLKEKKFLLKRA